MEFEWDENKRLSNLEKHGIDFEDLNQLFDGRHTVTTASDFQLEDRYLTVGNLSGRFITVVWTSRRNTVRIISARRARKAEIKELFDS